jgi:hypothetical protein
MALPPLTHEALLACAASPGPWSFYLPAIPDLVEGADLRLCEEGRELPVHCGVLAARASAFAPLLKLRPERLEDPFGITSLSSALLFLRLCYRPEEAPNLLLPEAGLVDSVPGGLKDAGGGKPPLPPAIACRVCFICILSPFHPNHSACSPLLCVAPCGCRQSARRAGAGRGAAQQPEQAQLLAWLDTSSCLPGLQLLAAECAARIVNGMHCTAGCFPVGMLAFAGQAVAGVPLDQLRPPALALLCRAALTVLADAQGRQQRHQSHQPADARQYVQQLRGRHVAAMMSQPVPAGAHTWRHGTVAHLTAQPIVSPPFR